MRRAAVLGHPIAHSLSPVLHRAAYAELGLDWSYELRECREQDLPATLAEGRWAGLSLTMPLKRAVIPLLDEVSELATTVRAVNTVVVSGGRTAGCNTDVHGIVAALAEAGVTRSAAPVVLGGGATAASALAALRRMGATTVRVVARDRERAAAALSAGRELALAVEFEPIEQFEVAVKGADLLISTLPAGAADAFAPIAGETVPAVLDVVYAPWPTALAATAGAAGATVVGGFAMLLHQAVRQVELMTGVTDRARVTAAMRAAGEAELARRG
jgi:shikimate dehydrogenase